MLSKKTDPAKGTVTPKEIVYLVTTANTDLYGGLVFQISDMSEGEYKYTVDVPEIGTLTLTYTNVEKETGNVCHPRAIVANDLVIKEYPSTIKMEGNKFIITIKI